MRLFNKREEWLSAVLLGGWLPVLAWAQGISHATERITKPLPTHMKA